MVSTKLELSTPHQMNVRLAHGIVSNSVPLCALASLLAAVCGANEFFEFEVENASEVRTLRFVRTGPELTVIKNDAELQDALERLRNTRVVASPHLLHSMVVEVAFGFRASDVLKKFLAMSLKLRGARRIITSDASVYGGEVVEIFIPGYHAPLALNDLEAHIATDLGLRGVVKL